MNYERLSTQELQELMDGDLQQLAEIEQAFTELTDRLSEVKAALARRDPVCQPVAA